MSIDLLTQVTKCSQEEAKEFIKKSVYIAIEARNETNKCTIYIILKICINFNFNSKIKQ